LGRANVKIVASKKKGMWMGGNVPLGYDVKDRKLIVSEPEASTVRVIFRRYAELGSVSLLKAELDRLGIVANAVKEPADVWPAANISPAAPST
jgi:site-specific DNA recombinase